MVQVIEGKIQRKQSEGKEKLLPVSRGGFELSRARVTEGKIALSRRRKSRRNRLWFELTRGLSLRGVELSRVKRNQLI